MRDMTSADLRGRLRALTTQSLSILATLEVAVSTSTPTVGGGGTRGRIDHSQPPWNAPVAHLITDLHAEARDMERTLRRHLNIPERARGGSAANTRHGLESVCNLAETARNPYVADCVSYLDRWVGRALVVLGERDQPQRLPRQPGFPEPACPYCELSTLRHFASRGEVRCVNPACTNDDGRRPGARMEWSSVAGEWVLVWNDNMVGLPV